MEEEGWSRWKVENFKWQWLRKFRIGRILEDWENLKFYKGIKWKF